MTDDTNNNTPPDARQAALDEITRENAQLMREVNELRDENEALKKKISLEVPAVSISMIYSPSTEETKILVAPANDLDLLIEAAEAGALFLRRVRRKQGILQGEKDQKI